MSDALRAYLEHPYRSDDAVLARLAQARAEEPHVTVWREHAARARAGVFAALAAVFPQLSVPDPDGISQEPPTAPPPGGDRGSRRLQPRPAAGAAGIAAAHVQRRRRRPAAAAHRRHPRRLRIAGVRVYRAQRAARRTGVDGGVLRQGPEQLGSRDPPSPRLGGRERHRRRRGRVARGTGPVRGAEGPLPGSLRHPEPRAVQRRAGIRGSRHRDRVAGAVADRPRRARIDARPDVAPVRHVRSRHRRDRRLRRPRPGAWRLSRRRAGSSASIGSAFRPAVASPTTAACLDDDDFEVCSLAADATRQPPRSRRGTGTGSSTPRSSPGSSTRSLALWLADDGVADAVDARL